MSGPYPAIDAALNLYADQAAIRNAIAAEFALPYFSGRYYFTLDGSVTSGPANRHNFIGFIPWPVRRPVTIDRLGVRITNGAAGNLQLAVYGSTNGRPSGNPLGVTPSISTVAATVVESALSGGNLTLQPGLHFIAINVDASAVTCQGYAIGENCIANQMGVTSAAQTSSAFNNAISEFLIAQTFGTWPNIPTNQSFTFTSQSGSPAAFFRVA